MQGGGGGEGGRRRRGADTCVQLGARRQRAALRPWEAARAQPFITAQFLRSCSQPGAAAHEAAPMGMVQKVTNTRKEMQIAVSPPVGSWGDVVPFVFCLRVFSREHLVIEVRGTDQSSSHAAAGKAGVK